MEARLLVREGLFCLLEHMFEISHSHFFKSRMHNLKHMFYALFTAKSFTHNLHAHRKGLSPSLKMVKLRLGEVVLYAQRELRVDPGSSNSHVPRSAWGRGQQRQGWGPGGPVLSISKTRLEAAESVCDWCGRDSSGPQRAMSARWKAPSH